MNKRTIITVVFSIIIIALMLWIANPSEFAEKLKEINLFYISIVIILYFGNVLTKAFRWYLLVNSTGSKISFRKTFPYYIIALAFNNVTPGKIGGEPIRAYLLKKDADIPVGQGLASIITEKIMDVTVVTIMAIIGAIFILPLLKPNEAIGLIIILIIAVIGIVSILIVLSHKGAFKKVIGVLINISAKRPNNKFLKKWTTAFIGFIEKFKLGLSNIFDAKRTTGACVGLTFVIWTNEAVRLFIILMAMPDVGYVSLGSVFIAASIANILGIVLPLGSANIFGIGTVFIALGMDPTNASLGGFLHAATSIWISIPLGVAAMLITGIKISKMKKQV